MNSTELHTSEAAMLQIQEKFEVPICLLLAVTCISPKLGAIETLSTSRQCVLGKENESMIKATSGVCYTVRFKAF